MWTTNVLFSTVWCSIVNTYTLFFSFHYVQIELSAQFGIEWFLLSQWIDKMKTCEGESDRAFGDQRKWFIKITGSSIQLCILYEFFFLTIRPVARVWVMKRLRMLVYVVLKENKITEDDSSELGKIQITNLALVIIVFQHLKCVEQQCRTMQASNVGLFVDSSHMFSYHKNAPIFYHKILTSSVSASRNNYHLNKCSYCWQINKYLPILSSLVNCVCFFIRISLHY